MILLCIHALDIDTPLDGVTRIGPVNKNTGPVTELLNLIV